VVPALGPEAGGLEPRDLPRGRVTGPYREEEVGAPSVGASGEGVVVGARDVVHDLGAESLESLAERSSDLVEAERDREVDPPPREPDGVTQLVAFAGFLALFFYVTLYMQNVLGYSAIQTGLAYLPLCGIAVVSAGITSQLIGRVGTRPVIVVGALIGAGGLYWLSRIPVGGSYTPDLLPGLLLVGLGIAGLFVAVATAANAGVPADKAGLAAALLNASQWLGGALGLAIFTAVSTSRTNHLLAAGIPAAHALTSGFQRALLVGSIFILASAVIALRATNTRGETAEPEVDVKPEASLAA